MRYIPLLENGVKPPEAWCKKADELKKQICQETDCQKRRELIEKNRKHWNDLADWLRQISHNKCWYTEAQITADYPEVDHYRPKKESLGRDGTKIHDGYYWMAFDWTNFRLSKAVPNRKKGAYFPLRDNARAVCEPNGPIYDELPYLLDPIKKYDCLLLSFTEDGRPCPAPDAEEWDRLRTEYSIERYKLDYGPLNDARKTVWQTCLSLFNEWLRCKRECNKIGSAAMSARVDEKLDQFGKLLREESPFSMVAITCLLSTGNPTIQRFAMAAMHSPKTH